MLYCWSHSTSPSAALLLPLLLLLLLCYLLLGLPPQVALKIKIKTRQKKKSTIQENPFTGLNFATPAGSTGGCLLANLTSELNSLLIYPGGAYGKGIAATIAQPFL
jgi:K+-transporting ATPase A subunit